MMMEKKIRSELLKMTGIMVVLIGLGIYAHDFVIAGIKAKVALNLSIFALAGLAASLAFRHVLALRNEVLALKALQVDFGNRSRRPINPYRHPAVVFQEPELLGQGYRMISEELGKQGDLHISNATVQVLLHDVDARINDRKSTIMYFSGLMVFMGLLGAFMGLMKTVHSVSDLIGSMDVSGGAGADSFGKMIEGMKAPLNGMSVGFSSSLFGLMTSMVLGALERFMTSAMKALRNEFEHWLSNLANLEGGQNDASAKVDADFTMVKRAMELGGRQMQDMRDVLMGSAQHSLETRSAMGEMAQAVTRLSETVEGFADPAPLLKPIADVVAELARNQMAMLSQFKAVYDQAEADRSHIHLMLNGMDATIDRMNTLNGDQLHKQLDNLLVLQSEMAQRDRNAVDAIAAAAVDTIAGQPAKRPGFFASLFAGRWAPRVDIGASSGEGRSLKREVRRMMLSHRRLTQNLGARITDRLAQMEAARDEDRKALQRLIAHAADQQARLEILTARDAGDGSAGELADAAGLHGARMEMDVLRQRLNAEIDADSAADRPSPSVDDGRHAGKKG